MPYKAKTGVFLAQIGMILNLKAPSIFFCLYLNVHPNETFHQVRTSGSEPPGCLHNQSHPNDAILSIWSVLDPPAAAADFLRPPYVTSHQQHPPPLQSQ